MLIEIYEKHRGGLAIDLGELLSVPRPEADENFGNGRQDFWYDFAYNDVPARIGVRHQGNETPYAYADFREGDGTWLPLPRVDFPSPNPSYDNASAALTAAAVALKERLDNPLPLDRGWQNPPLKTPVLKRIFDEKLSSLAEIVRENLPRNTTVLTDSSFWGQFEEFGFSSSIDRHLIRVAVQYTHNESRRPLVFASYGALGKGKTTLEAAEIPPTYDGVVKGLREVTQGLVQHLASPS